MNRFGSAEEPRREFEVFFDGDCPLCVREIAWLKRKDTKSRILFTDISTADFAPEAIGRTYPELMARIHGRTTEGSLVVGVEVFRRIYAALGWRTLVAITRWPGIRQLLAALYAVFASNRLRLTGRRCDPAGACRTSSAPLGH